jgi:hypothetical protein
VFLLIVHMDYKWSGLLHKAEVDVWRKKNLAGVHVPENGGSNPPHSTKNSQKKFEKNLEL